MCREAYGESNEFAITIRGNNSAVQGNNFFCDGKTKPGTTGVGSSGFIQTEKFLKERRQFFFWDNVAIVFYVDFSCIILDSLYITASKDALDINSSGCRG